MGTNWGRCRLLSAEDDDLNVDGIADVIKLRAISSLFRRILEFKACQVKKTVPLFEATLSFEIHTAEGWEKRKVIERAGGCALNEMKFQTSVLHARRNVHWQDIGTHVRGALVSSLSKLVVPLMSDVKRR